MNLLGGVARTSHAQAKPEVGSAMRIQRSVNGAAVPVVYGTARLPGNLIWYGDFKATPKKSGGKSGGKGGVTGSSAKGQAGDNTYQASFAVALCAGAIQGIGQVWDTTGAADTPPSLGGGVTIQAGASGQAPWGYLAALHPDQALGYNGLAYVGLANMPLGESPSLPNLSFEVIGFGPAAIPTTWSVPPSGHAWQTSYAPPSYPTAPFAAIAAVVKTPAARQNIVFDTAPAFCIADLLTSSNYGAGLAPGLIGDLTQYATWCQAAGIGLSAALTEQRDCRSILRDWLDATLADAYWSQGQIKIASFADQAVTGTAADGSSITYTPNLTPVMSIDNSLMLAGASGQGGGDAGPLTVTRKDPAEVSNRITIEYSDRDSAYNTVTVTADDAAHIAAYGLRPAPNLRADFITVGAVAQRIADLRLARETGVLATYEWRMRSPGELLEPFDVVAISDAALGLANYPVRVTEVEEEDDSVFHITGEDIPGVMAVLAARPVAVNDGAVSGANADPGSINPPIIFEPPSALCVSGSGLELWAMVSGAATTLWGGCDVWASTDGATYAFVGTISGAARMGLLTAPLPAVAAASSGTTVDAADALAVDLSQSAGQLAGTDQPGALALNTLCYCDGELLAYQNATLGAAASHYALTWLVRGAYGSAISAHAAGAGFARLDGAQLRYPFTADRIGQTIYFKFLSFNIQGGGAQTLDQVQPFAYRLTGTALAEDPANVTGLATAYIGGLTQLIWNPVADPRAIDYEIRLGSADPVRGWASGQVIGRTPLLQAPILGDGTYWVAAHFKVPNGPDVYSPAPAEVEVNGSALTSNVIASHSQVAEGWKGTFVNTAVAGGFLTLLGRGDVLAAADVTASADIRYLGGAANAGSYQIPAADRVNIGRVAACNVLITLGATIGYDLGAVDIATVADITALTDLLGVDLGNRVAAVPQIRLSQDGIVWGPWQNWIPGRYSAMAFDAQVLLTSADANIAAVLTDFIFAVDVPDRVDTGTDVALPAGGAAVTFTTPFNGGPGAASLPNLQITIHAAAQGDQIVTSARSLNGFTVQVINGGIGVARTIDWLAQGY